MSLCPSPDGTVLRDSGELVPFIGRVDRRRGYRASVRPQRGRVAVGHHVQNAD